MKSNSVLSTSNTFDYLMLFMSVFLIISKSSFSILGILIFTLTAFNLIEKKLIDKKPDSSKRLLDMTFRLLLSICIILLILNELFIELEASLVLYIIILSPLTFLLILTRK